MSKAIKEAEKILKQYYGYDHFREGQIPVIEAVLEGRDVLGIMPTGAGKSVCYQVPALMMKGITIVISPLISLMKDQVGTLNQMGVHAAFLNSSLTSGQYYKALQLAKQGRYKIIYVAPERLETESFLDFALSEQVQISFVAVDEAHCVSQWGQDFRPGYLKILDFLDRLSYRPVVGAYTATATAEVREDILDILRLQNPYVETTGFDRGNLFFAVKKPVDKYKELVSYLKEKGYDTSDDSGIIYCLTRKSVEQVSFDLRNEGFSVTRYHAGLSDEERKENQENFIYGKRQIMVATNAFGMGIDKPDVRFVIHYNMPKNMESYYQEAGRAGRDGAKADCILFYSGQDVITNQFFIEQDRDNEELTGEALEEVRRQDRERLKKMTFYCHTTDCLRDYMLRYFGEFGSNYCGNCSNCLNTFETIDITELANDLIGCILTSGMRFGVNVILDTLRGSKNEKVLRFGLDSNRYYATHAQDTIVFLRQVLNYLVLTDYLVVTDDQFPIVKVKEKGLSFYAESGEFRPVLTMKAARKTTQTPAKAGQLPGTDKSGRKRSSLHTGSDPFEALRRLRTEIARAQHIPPYLVFSDKSLESMCVLLPQTKTEMLAVHGVGELKYQKYGEQFLALCQKLAGESEEF